MCFDHIHPTLPRPTPSSSKHCVLSLQPIKANLFCPNKYSWIWSSTGTWSTYQRPHLEKMSLPLPAADNANISTAGVGLCAQLPSPQRDLVQCMFYAQCCDHCEFCTTPLRCSEDTIAMQLSMVPGSYILLAPTSAMIPETWEEGCNINAPFRAGHSPVSRSLHLGHLWVSLFTNIYCKQKFLS